MTDNRTMRANHAADCSRPAGVRLGRQMDRVDKVDGGGRRRRFVWIGRDDEVAGVVRRGLAAEGVDLDVREIEADFAVSAAALVGEPIDLLVCDCSGDRGCERAFFVCREAGPLPVVLFAVGPEVEEGAVTILMAGLIKALPNARVTMVTDRIAEVARPTGASLRAQWGGREAAKTLCGIAGAPDAHAGETFRLRRDGES